MKQINWDAPAFVGFEPASTTNGSTAFHKGLTKGEYLQMNVFVAALAGGSTLQEAKDKADTAVDAFDGTLEETKPGATSLETPKANAQSSGKNKNW